MKRKISCLIITLVFSLTSYGNALAYGIERLSTSIDGGPSIEGGHMPVISPDGRFIAYASDSDDLVPVDTNGYRDIFVYDRVTGDTEMVSVYSDGTQMLMNSFWPALSDDGRFVVFVSSNAPYSGGNAQRVFVRDRETGVTEAVEKQVGLYGRSGYGRADISGDGRYVVYRGASSRNGKVIIYDRQTGAGQLIPYSVGWAGHPRITSNGKYVLFAESWNLIEPYPYRTAGFLYLYDRENETIEFASINTNGEVSGFNGGSGTYDFTINADGSYLVYRLGNNVMLNDRLNSTVTEIQSGNYCYELNDTGNILASYYGYQVSVSDLETGESEVVSVNEFGDEGNGLSRFPAISNDGNYIVFQSSATNLLPGDTSGKTHIYLVSRSPKVPRTIDELMQYTKGLYKEGHISNQGILNSLIRKLENASKASDKGNTWAASNILIAFANEVQALSGKKIEIESAEILLKAAAMVMDK